MTQFNLCYSMSQNFWFRNAYQNLHLNNSPQVTVNKQSDSWYLQSVPIRSSESKIPKWVLFHENFEFHERVIKNDTCIKTLELKVRESTLKAFTWAKTLADHPPRMITFLDFILNYYQTEYVCRSLMSHKLWLSCWNTNEFNHFNFRWNLI